MMQIFRLYFVYICRTISYSWWLLFILTEFYRKTSNISRTLVGYKIVDNSDVVGASPVGAAPTTSSFSTWHLASMDWSKTTARRNEKHLNLGFGATYTRGFTVDRVYSTPLCCDLFHCAVLHCCALCQISLQRMVFILPQNWHLIRFCVVPSFSCVVISSNRKGFISQKDTK